jgi:hypothetical protein
LDDALVKQLLEEALRGLMSRRRRASK